MTWPPVDCPNEGSEARRHIAEGLRTTVSNSNKVVKGEVLLKLTDGSLILNKI